jgi:hypothetical protein
LKIRGVDKQEQLQRRLARVARAMHSRNTMKTKQTKKGAPVSETANRKERVETALVAGAVAGAAVGAMAGPPGVLIGGVVGGVTGVVAGRVLADDAERRHAHANEIDRDIGVTGGDMGAASPDQPPARIGAYSGGSAGAGSTSTRTPAEGPMQDVED